MVGEVQWLKYKVGMRYRWGQGGFVILLARGCGGSMVVHQAVKPAVPGSNSTSLQPAACRDMSFLVWGASRVGMITAGLRGGRRKKIQKYQKNNKEKNNYCKKDE